MKRYYLKDLKNDELIKIFNNNEKLKNQIIDSYYEDQMYWQSEYYNILLNYKDNKSNFNYNDYYTSFYLTIKDGLKFLENINFNEIKDYFNIEDIEKIDKIEKKYKKELNYINRCNYYSDNFYKHNEIIDQLASDLLKIIENELHKFENYDFKDIEIFFIDEIKENTYYENYYIKNKKDFIVYEKICYEKSYK